MELKCCINKCINLLLRLLGILSREIERERDSFTLLLIAKYMYQTEACIREYDLNFNFIYWYCVGANVLVHGSEGFDSTLQITSLVQIVLDHDCRTINGWELKYLQVDLHYIAFHHFQIYSFGVISIFSN